MSRSTFDDKFGADFIARAPRAPGVYRYLGASGEVLYVGKAKDLRRRFRDYRSATNKKIHRKRRALVRAATSLCYEELPTEEDALLREAELIRELRPAYNVEGAYTSGSLGSGVSALDCAPSWRSIASSSCWPWLGIARRPSVCHSTRASRAHDWLASARSQPT
jgi:predicted GIY-YIG superfamily endonuclease